MSSPRKLTPEEVLREVERMEAEELAAEEKEIDRILAKSPEEVRKDLAAMGVDLDKQRRKGEEVQKKFAALSPPRSKVRRLPVRTVLLIAAVFLGLAFAAYAARRPLLRLFSHEEQVGPRNPTPHEIADQLRDRAFDACQAYKWDECRKLLEEAYDKDPEGSDEPRVDVMWRAIGLSQTPGGKKVPWVAKLMAGLDAGALLDEGGAPGDKPTP